MSVTDSKKIPFREGVFCEPQEANEKPYLIGEKCVRCGSVQFPKKILCTKCYNESMKEVRLGHNARLYSYFVARVAPSGFNPPYVMGIVDLPEKIRITCQLECDPEEAKEALHTGMNMELVIGEIRRDKNGNVILGPKFRPID